MPHLIDADILVGKSLEWATDLVNLFADRLTSGSEIVALYDECFDDEFEVADDARTFLTADNEGSIRTLTAFIAELEALEEFSAECIKDAIKATGKVAEVKGKNLFMPCRIGASGAMHGPDLPVLVSLLGREVVVDRLRAVIKEL